MSDYSRVRISIAAENLNETYMSEQLIHFHVGESIGLAELTGLLGTVKKSQHFTGFVP
jgi:hypothetical protein